MKEIYHKLIIVGFGGIIAGIIGYAIGFSAGIKFMIIKATEFFLMQGVDFSLPASQISELVNKYLGIIATKAIA